MRLRNSSRIDEALLEAELAVASALGDAGMTPPLAAIARALRPPPKPINHSPGGLGVHTIVDSIG
jgi:hypothetical protein